MPFNTRNPIPSGDLRDLDDNARNIDTWANDKTKLSHPDRFGVERYTWHGIEQKAQLDIAAGVADATAEAGQYRDQAIDAKNAAQEAAMMSGFSKYADTLAQLESGIGTDYIEGDVVMVFEDESRGDTSSIYKVESGAAEFKLTFDKTRQDLLSFTGNISADAQWSDVPAHSDPAFDVQAQALANRTEAISEEISNAELNFDSVADANADSLIKDGQLVKIKRDEDYGARTTIREKQGAFYIPKGYAKNLVTLSDYGAFGKDNDYTSEINRALDDGSQYKLKLLINSGEYGYSGQGHPYAGVYLNIVGEGKESTNIKLASGSRLIDTATRKVSLLFSGLQVRGGIGAYRSTFDGVDVSFAKRFTDNVFVGYTGCAIDLNAQDCPYWTIDGNTFWGADSVNTIGVALHRWADVSRLEGNAFIKNRIHLKLRSAGINVSVFKNDFIQFDTGNGTPRASIWFVPGATNAGQGARVHFNKLGLENLHANDFRIIYAPEGAGESNGLKMPVLNADSAEFVVGASIKENMIAGSDVASPPLVYSTTPNIRGMEITDNQLQFNKPESILKFRTVPTNYDDVLQSNKIGNNRSVIAGFASTPVNISNDPAQMEWVDETYQSVGDSKRFYPHTSGANDRVGFVSLYTSRGRSIAVAGGGSIVSVVTDATGESDAVIASLPNFAAVNANLTGMQAGEIAWAEVDIMAGGDTPLSEVVFRIAVGSQYAMKRVISVPANKWFRVRVPFVLRSTSSASMQVINLSGSTGTVKVGRLRAYHAREPVTFGRAKFEQLDLSGLPTSSTGLASGSLWVDISSGGVVKVVA